ncbi:molybdenum cofactor guanylyltransferase [Dyadobacter sp. CY347]|uniref:molybdenum cofactor guanylyltransferase n=1 Tax=Dyadobacter sp. CY347 TaxID=2909336 RepID=UPI001F2D52A8|nr:NTP transferase domain-containing protein [Dyadobacter sp. CY347]MCF2487099.1 NTP transferase domain-containing protein [Dyadobacter sp. CY347]
MIKLDVTFIVRTMALYGLAVCGGKSLRMGTDKSQLQYFDIPQADRVVILLSPICTEVFLSCNPTQAAIFENNKIITDLPEYEDIGPMAALLSAFKTYPNADFLVAGCDYPFLTPDALTEFLSSIQTGSIAAAFYNADGKYEPLLAWYAKEAAPLLFERFERGHHSLQHFLREIHAEKYIPKSEKVMISVDTPEVYDQVKAALNVHIEK